MHTFRGSYTVMVTPFDSAGHLDEERLRIFVDWQIDQGVQGLIPLGSTGEFLSLTREERTRVGGIVIEQAKGRVPVLIGTAAEWTDEAVAFSREAEQLGADGVMIVPPFYSSPTEDELFEHYRRIGDAISVPIMIYNNPYTSNVDLKPTLVSRLAEIDNVNYIKESSGDVTRVTQILRLCGERMTVFAGYHPWESFLAGATGYVSVFSNIAPSLSRDLFVTTVEDGEPERGREIYSHVMPLLDAISGDLYVSATKAALALSGMPVGAPRLPRLPLPEAKLAPLADVLADLGLLDSRAA
ncbi:MULTISPECIES: 4-hydroxy-tetrahydrodipicolinate synthase [unclassified Aurantimonas]|uniref:4-hydroxy-tetrahydrodipicolinate synthase n=1 Tax=unclassified Aurantimonas TaxID=2638230 RepID=UPI002E173A79|nr:MULTISPECIES: 4-hydroxy-tetrahydrodipicolinate synthase [unclassified Aurantimonas]MEC5293115.1 4-hydroxy-tetrahydrodipicolinate synthase [Aurantimonas sp. C2-3-R2]MEC5414184.1 4-hydroxy-tetrahydrodipicolinate synthase [Aurantimonas sp. C2-4-R8]